MTLYLTRSFALVFGDRTLRHRDVSKNVPVVPSYKQETNSSQRSTFNSHISFSICLLYVGLQREWLLNELQRRSANRVMFPYQHRVSTQKCCRCESAADLSHFSLAVPSRPLCRSAPHRIQLRGARGVENIDFPGPPALGHLRLWESTAVSAPPKRHGSCSCLTQTYRTMLSVFTKTAQAREYISRGQHSHLDGLFSSLVPK